jgi:hypothetical protein
MGQPVNLVSIAFVIAEGQSFGYFTTTPRLAVSILTQLMYLCFALRDVGAGIAKWLLQIDFSLLPSCTSKHILILHQMSQCQLSRVVTSFEEMSAKGLWTRHGPDYRANQPPALSDIFALSSIVFFHQLGRISFSTRAEVRAGVRFSALR